MADLALPDFPLEPAHPLAEAFLACGLADYHAAAHYVWGLPYGRTRPRADYRQVLDERRGTCSTKHALLAALAREHTRPVALWLGIYTMDESNTPGAGAALGQFGLASVPEAHCYLIHQGHRVDLTHARDTTSPTFSFFLEERIEPEDIGAYKTAQHQTFLREWAANHALDYAHVWRAREHCIAALSI